MLLLLRKDTEYLVEVLIVLFEHEVNIFGVLLSARALHQPIDVTQSLVDLSVSISQCEALLHVLVDELRFEGAATRTRDQFVIH